MSSPRALIFILTILIFSDLLQARDCSNLKPFKKIDSQRVHISVSRFFWTADEEGQEDLCAGDLDISVYDVRGREEDAYYCLHPKESEVFTCKTILNGEDAAMFIVPASWMRRWKPKDMREYRFHSYVVKTNDSNFYFDIFSRSLSTRLSSQNLMIEGAIKTGPGNRSDGYFVRAEFKRK